MRYILALFVLLLLAGCQQMPASSGAGRGYDDGNRDGGMCSPYASGCW